MSFDSPIARIIIVVLALAVIFLGAHYFTTQTETGQNLRAQVTEGLFGVFTEEYNDNADTNNF